MNKNDLEKRFSEEQINSNLERLKSEAVKRRENQDVKEGAGEKFNVKEVKPAEERVEKKDLKEEKKVEVSSEEKKSVFDIFRRSNNDKEGKEESKLGVENEQKEKVSFNQNMVKTGVRGVEKKSDKSNINAGATEGNIIKKLKENKEVLEEGRDVVIRAPVYKIEKKKNEKILEDFEIEVDGAKVKVLIKKNEMGVTYNLYFPEVNPATSFLLKEIRNELITLTTVSMKELSDPAAFVSIKKRFMGDARKILNEKLPGLDEGTEKYLIGILMQEMMGLGKIEFLVDDPGLEEIVIPSAKETIRVYSKKHGWLMTNVKIDREDEIINYSNIIARRVGRQITVLSPLLDAHLVTGDRVNAVLYPINTKGNTITIRKFARDPLTIIDLINNKTCDINLASILWLAMEFEMNILISGGTGSGKTSFLNAMMPFISPNQRIISIEDTRELMLPDFLYWSPLVTRTPNPEGKGEVSMLHLLVNSLRMRPDRIVLGEMRRQEEAMVLFEAMHTGHSVYATVHADSAAETISRLVNPPLSVPPNLLKSVNLNVVMFRDRKKGIRRVMQVAEFDAEKAGARSNILYRWVPDNDQIVKHSENSRFFEDIARNTGMSQKEIDMDLEEKKKVISWLVKSNTRDLQEFGRVMNLYYRNKDLLKKAISKNDKKIIFGRDYKELKFKDRGERENAIDKEEIGIQEKKKEGSEGRGHVEVGESKIGVKERDNEPKFSKNISEFVKKRKMVKKKAVKKKKSKRNQKNKILKKKARRK